MKPICLVTTTRDRPEYFAVLEKLMQRQTKWWSEWIVVNDCTNPHYHYTMDQTVLYRDFFDDNTRQPWLPSICNNWLHAIEYLKTKPDCYILPIEDDDYYAPNYIETITAMLDEVQLCGISRDAYYKLPSKHYKWMANTNHASLACTGFRKDVLPHIERSCNVFRSVFVDMYLWAEFGTPDFPGTRKLLPQSHTGKKLHVGMKNMPGIAGLGMGHQAPDGWNKDYENMRILRDWVSPDAYLEYRKMYQDHFARA